MTNVSAVRRAACATALCLVTLSVAPAFAYRLIQNTGVGRFSAGSLVQCNDPIGFTHWNQESIEWFLNPANQGSGKAAAMSAALASWTNVTPATYDLTYGGTTGAGWATDGVNTALWASGNGCTGTCLALTALVLEAGQVIVESDVTFNNNYSWNTNGSNHDVEAVMAHELGHTMGIHHTELTGTPRPTMFATYFGTDGRTLESDDIAALNCIYDRYPPPQVTVTYPNGGETFTAGTVPTITWTSVGSFTTVDIDYSTNGGSSWVSVVTGTPNDGWHPWTVPSVATTQGRIRVTGGSATDMSNGNFTIVIPPAPVADFTGSPTSGPGPLAVQFTDLTTNSPTSWLWNFGDGGTSTQPDPLHTYDCAGAGTYTVSLTATNAGGSDNVTKTNYITVTASGSASCGDAVPWTQRATLTGGARWDHSGIWDPVNRRVIVYGGRNAGGTLSDLQSYSPASDTWTQLTPSGGPGARWGHTAIYDPVRARMLVFGGIGDDGNVWALSTNGTPAWTQVTANGGPARYEHVAIYDSQNDRMVVFAGSPLETSTWALDLGTNTWTELNNSYGPIALDGCAAIYDPPNQRMVVYGGKAYCSCICPTPSLVTFSELWAMPMDVPSPNWQYLGDMGYPLAEAGAVYDPACQQMLIFGGLMPTDCAGSCGAYRENPTNIVGAISLSGTPTWTTPTTCGGPPRSRGHHVAVLDPVEHQLFTFGGGDHYDEIVTGCTTNPVQTYHEDAWILTLPDLTPPATVSLGAASACATVNLSWLAPGDDGSIGTASLYDLRASTSTITAQNFSSATQIASFPPTGPAGTPQSTTHTVGACSPRYYYALKTLDDSGNWSEISNVPSGKATCCGGSGCPVVLAHGSDGWVRENTILGRSLDGRFVEDLYRVKTAVAVENGAYRMMIIEDEEETTTLDQVGLLAVDHEPSLRAIGVEGRPVLGSLAPAVRVTTEDGASITELLSGSSSESTYTGTASEIIYLEFPPAESGFSRTIVVEAKKKEIEAIASPERMAGPIPTARLLNETGVKLEYEDEAGDWQLVAHRYPREYLDALAFEVPVASRYRLVLVGKHAIASVGCSDTAVPATEDRRTLLSAHHSRLGEVSEALLHADRRTIELRRGDQLELRFEASDQKGDGVRDLFLATTGVYTTEPINLDASPPTTQLSQNQPNPFSALTEVAFTLSRAGEVRLEVFDLQGRSVAVLAEGRHLPGTHSVHWNGLDSAKRRVSPGVYLYRLQAGEIEVRKRMIVLP